MQTQKIILILLITSVLTCCSDRQNITIDFERVNGLTEKSIVVYKGLEIGEVLDIGVNENGKISVTISIDNDFNLPKYPDFVIVKRDLLGTKAIEIRESNKSSALIKDKGFQGTVEEKNLIDSISKEIKNLINNSTADSSKIDSLLIELRRLNQILDRLPDSQNIKKEK
jgi:ABC-type transporter Mla subunit MlaD